jgi:tape measure domain-containing protein
MASVVDTLITEYKLDSKGYTSNAADVVTSTNKMGGAVNGLKAGLTAGLGIATAFAGAIAAAVGAFVAVGAQAARAAADFDALVKSLEAVVGGSKRAAEALAVLREIARAPGIGLKEAIGGFTGLVNAGLSPGFATRALREFANANAKAGGGPEQFAGIIRQVSQMATKPFLQGEELSTLTENGIPAYRLIKDIFGTSDTEELKKRGIGSAQVLTALVAALEKTERVAGGAKNSFDNLGDAWDYAMVTMGQAVNESIMPMVNALADLIDVAARAGVLKSLAETFMSMFRIDELAAEKPKDLFLDILETVVVLGAQVSNVINNLKGLFNALAIAGGAFFDQFAQAVKFLGGGAQLDPIEQGKNFRKLAADQLAIQEKKDAQGPQGLPAWLQDAAGAAGKAGKGGSSPWLTDAIAAGMAGANDQTVSEMQTQTGYLAEITAIQKRQFDLLQGSLGGGSVGRVGIAAREMVDIRRRSRPAMVPG